MKRDYFTGKHQSEGTYVDEEGNPVDREGEPLRSDDAPGNKTNVRT